MPVRVHISGAGRRWLRPTEAWQRLAVPSPPGAEVAVDEDFYVTTRNVAARPADSRDTSQGRLR